MWKLSTEKCSIQISKDNISRNKNIILIKEDKGRGVVVLDRKHCVQKCLNILELGQFKKLEKDGKKRCKNDGKQNGTHVTKNKNLFWWKRI